MDEINKTIAGNNRQQRLLTDALKEPLKTTKKQPVKQKLGRETPTSVLEGLGPHSPTTGRYAGLIADDALVDTRSEAGSVMGGGSQSGNDDNEALSAIEMGSVSGTEIPSNQNDRKDAAAEFLEEQLFDDGLSTLTADEYVKIRLIPMMAKFSVKAPGLNTGINTVTCVVIGLSVCSSVFSSFDLTVFIPLCMAFSSAMTAWMSYKQTELRLLQTNGAKQTLHQLMVWWDSLSMIEKRVPSNKENLVQVTESSIQGQVVSYTSASRGNSEEDGEGN